MTREQMLKKMGLSDHDFRDYVAKSTKFIDSLNAAQMQFHLNSKQPPASLEEAARALGPDVTTAQLTELFAGAPVVDGVCLGINVWCAQKHPCPASVDEAS